jgi:hypothetical protein
MYKSGEVRRITFFIFIQEDANECNNKNGENCNNNSAANA